MRRPHRALAWLAGAALLAVSLACAAQMSNLSERYVKLVLAVGSTTRTTWTRTTARRSGARRQAAKLPLHARSRATPGLASRELADSPALPGADASCGCGTHYLERQLQRSARVAHARAASGSRSTRSRGRSTTPSRRAHRAALPARPARARRALPGERARCSSATRRSASAFVIPKERLDAGLPRRHRRVPRPDARAHRAAGGESFTVEYVTDKPWSGYNWYQGNYQQPDPGQHRPADLHRPRDRPRLPRGLSRPPRLQRAAREEPRARPRLGGVHGLPAVLAAVADRRGHRELRHRGGVPGRRARRLRARRLFPARRPRPGARRRSTTRRRSSSSGSRTPATRRRGDTWTGRSTPRRPRVARDATR